MATQITDHVQRAVARLCARDVKDNIVAFISALVTQIQFHEDALTQLFNLRGVDVAEGQQLDDLGVIVGQPRDGLSDTDYRRYIRARIAANNSDGLVEDVIRVTRGILNNSVLGVKVEQYFPAALLVRIQSGSLDATTADTLIEFLRDTRAGGVGIQAHHMLGDPDDTFELGSVTNILTSIVTIGSTSFEVTSTDGFPDSGTLILEYLGATPETWTYTSKDATHFYGAATTQIHSLVDVVKTADSSTQGTSDTTAPTVGGELASVLE